MANPRDVIIDQLGVGQRLIGMFTEGVSDQEYFERSTEETNHIAWLLGHIACTEDWAVVLITGSASGLPPLMHELFTKGCNCLPDASRYPARAEIDEHFAAMRVRTVEALRLFDESRWDEESPEGSPRDFFPTLGSLWGLLATHQFWHIGQIAVCRAVLKKPAVL